MDDQLPERGLETRSFFKIFPELAVQIEHLGFAAPSPPIDFQDASLPITLLLGMVFQIVHQDAFVPVQAHRLDPYSSNRESKDPRAI